MFNRREGWSTEEKDGQQRIRMVNREEGRSIEEKDRQLRRRMAGVSLCQDYVLGEKPFITYSDSHLSNLT